MKKFIFCLLMLGMMQAAAARSYTVIEHPYRFSTYFEMHGQEAYEGRVVKSALTVRTIYDLYDNEATYIGQGICRLLSLGSIYPWARMVDLYDASGNAIGLIEGRVMTTAKASYNLYDASGNIVGIAYLNLDCSSFTIQDTAERVVAALKRNFTGRKIDSWEVTIFDTNSLDERILKLFSIFAVDNQQYFKMQ